MTTFRDYENFISNNLYILNQNNPTGLFDLAIDLKRFLLIGVEA